MKIVQLSTQSADLQLLLSRDAAKLIGHQGLILLEILYIKADSNLEVRMTIEKLSEYSDRSKEATRRTLDILIAHNFITTVREGRRNIYRLSTSVVRPILQAD